MKKTEVRDLLYQELGPLFPGFRLKKRDEGFVRAIPGGVQKVVVPLFDYYPVFIFSLAVCIRLEEVENIFNLFSGSPPKYQTMTLTTMTPLSYFFPGYEGKKEYKVTSEDEVKSAVLELSPVIHDRILPFLAEHQDVKGLDAVMNSGAGLRFDRSNQPYRAMHAIILAYLARNSRFEDIVKGYQEEMRKWQDTDQKKLSDLVSYLGYYPASQEEA